MSAASVHDPAIGEPDELTRDVASALARIRAAFAAARAEVAAWRLPDEWTNGTDPYDPGHSAT